MSERTRALQATYGFRCNCARCKVGSWTSRPALELSRHLHSMHAALPRPRGRGAVYLAEVVWCACVFPLQVERAAPAPVTQLLEDMYGWLANGDLVARVKTQV